MKGEFYKMDYESWDEGTDQLSLEQEAAYLRLCHQLYRRKASIPSTPATLARIWRCHPNKARKLLADLIQAGKIIERDGHLSNTRVTRELDDRETRRTQQADAGHIGGTRAQENRRKPLKTNERDAADASRAAKRNQAEREIEGEKKEQIEASPPSETRESDYFPSNAFDLFWAEYPEKVGKDPARKSFAQVRKSRRVTFAALMAGLARYRATKPIDRSWCHPTTWLNQGRWADQPAPPVGAQARASPVAQHSSPQQRALDRARQAHLDLTEERHDQDPIHADAEGGFGASRSQNGHSGASLHQPLGGRPGWAPPRLAGPSRPH